MEILIAISIFGAIFFSSLGIFLANSSQEISSSRLLRALNQANLTSEESLPFKQRVLIPLLNKIAEFFGRRTSKEKLTRINKKLSAAGLAGKWSSSEWGALQYGLGIVSGLCSFGLFSITSSARLTNLGLAVVVMIICYILPDFWLNSRVQNRHTEIMDTLPDVLDLLTVSVEAGLGFDSALLTVSEKRKGVLGQEFLKLLQEIRMGRPRREALRDMSKRIEVEDLNSLIASLIQADQLGISIGGVLRNQAEQIRQKRRQRTEEKAQKAPVKMMIPLVFFVFPSVFIIILGPAVIQIIKNYKV
jgi:Flp pilus assembly protein TadC